MLLTDENEGELESQLFLLDKVDLSSGLYNLDRMFDIYRRRVSLFSECITFVRAIDKYFTNHIDYINSEEFYQLVIEILDH